MDKIDYPGDHVKDLHNRILGPDANGDFFVVTDAQLANNVTSAFLRPATEDEVENCNWDKAGNRVLADA